MQSVLPVLFLQDLSPGLQVRVLRIVRGWRQADLAKAADTAPATVSAYERGEYVPPSIARRIRRAVGLPEDPL